MAGLGDRCRGSLWGVVCSVAGLGNRATRQIGHVPKRGFGPIMRQRKPELVFWPSCFLEAWGTKAKNHLFLENVWFFGLGTPGLQKTLGQKTTSGSL
jgi:hypothetical protein